MTFTVHWIDVAPHLAAGTQPVAVVPRRPPSAEGHGVGGRTRPAGVGAYWVPLAPLDGAPLARDQWAVTAAGDFVRVPVFAYRTAVPGGSGRSAAAIFGLGVQLGLSAAAQVLAAGGHVRAVALALGNVCTDLVDDDAFRCYLGLALVTDSK